jgi:glycosyltransferase involved in cell wall biosynthesis
VLTVLMATLNGGATLRAVLESYQRLESPRGGWSLVVVDNGSTDDTPQILAAFASRLPLTALSEPAAGKNAALNAGLRHVAGDLVVFADDDGFPRPDWLVRLREAADEHRDVDVFGGRVVPRWAVPPPEWLLRLVPLGPTYTLSDESLRDGPTSSSHVFGPNMAVRTSVFEAGHRFDPNIGPRGLAGYPMGSETEFVRRMARVGARLWHVHAAVVEHFIETRQMRPSWVLQRAVRFGRGQHRLARAESSEASPRLWFGVPRHLFRQLLAASAGCLAAAATFDGDRAFRSRWRLSFVCGEMLEARKLALEARQAGPPA